MSSDSVAGVERPGLVASLPDAALEEINRLWTITRAFSCLAHDVNNAMQVIAGSAELLESRDLDPVVRRRVEAIRTESTRAAETLNRLLEYVQQRQAAVQRLDIWPVVEAAVTMRASSAGRRRVVIAIERGNSSPAFATVDQTKALQALLDMLLSAEDRIAGLKNAKISVTIAQNDPVTVTLNASGQASAAAETKDEVIQSPLTSGLQMWTAARLAASLGGRLEIVGADDSWKYLLTLPT